LTDPTGPDGDTIDTRAVHLGRPPREPGGPLNPAIALSATFHQDGDLVYGRDGNPTWTALEQAVGGLEGGQALSFASGTAAMAAIIETLPIPGRVVIAADAYHGTRRLLADLGGRGRLRARSVDVADTEATLQACADLVDAPARPSGRRGELGAGGLLWLESPTNPMLAVADLRALTAGAHELGLDVVVDNTLATPVLQRPLDFGVDVVVHSATKAIAGHSDVLLGVLVSRRDDIIELLRSQRAVHGAIAGPFEAWLALRGLRTLPLRVRHSQATAGELARRLVDHPGVTIVRYPGLPDDPGHDLAAAQMDGAGFMVSFEVAGDAEATERVARATRIATAATSLGGVETLIERRHRWAGDSNVPPSLLRLSVGIEDLEDLWADLSRAIDTGLAP
jgi:cystathionine gamma-synthase